MSHRLIFLITISLVFSACNSEKQEIKKVAENYLDAMANYRIEEAEPYATEETRNITLRFAEEVIMPHLTPNVIPDNTPASVEITSVKITTDSTATVNYTLTRPLLTTNDTINLLKRNNEWRIHFVVDVTPLLIMLNSNDTTSEKNTTIPKKIIMNDSTH